MVTIGDGYGPAPYIVCQKLDGSRLYVWVERRKDPGKPADPFCRFCQHATSNPKKYCKIIAKAERYAKVRNKQRQALLAAMERECQ